MSRRREIAVPTGALLQPTLLVTGASAAAVYAQPAAELKRLADAGAIVKIARGIYAAVPVGKQAENWLPSMEDLASGIASVVYGPGVGVLWGLSAARVHGALPRAISVGYACGPAQHRPITLLPRSGQVLFSKRNTDHLGVEYFDTELGPGLVTSKTQTILDLSRSSFDVEGDLRTEAVRTLMMMVDLEELADLAAQSRGMTALARARKLVSRAQRN